MPTPNKPATNPPPRGWRTDYPLPQKTAEFANQNFRNSGNQNLGLWLDKFVRWNQQGRNLELKPNLGSSHRDAPMLQKGDENILSWKIEKDLLVGVAKRWEQMLLNFTHRDAFFGTPEWRFVIGLGGASVLETSVTLHRLYGIPIIPGSALKGVTRAYAEAVLAKPANDPEVVAIFGKPPQATPLEAGEIIFFDAIPVTVPKFKLDIMNPHYPKYYQGDQPPADWQNPTPIYFLTVEQTQFLFAVATRREEGKAYINTALEWLKKGLAELGVGAKTAAGYGYFEEVK
jgi:CRISPR-associated protein Cmr6